MFVIRLCGRYAKVTQAKNKARHTGAGAAQQAESDNQAEVR